MCVPGAGNGDVTAQRALRTVGRRVGSVIHTLLTSHAFIDDRRHVSVRGDVRTVICVCADPLLANYLPLLYPGLTRALLRTHQPVNTAAAAVVVKFVTLTGSPAIGVCVKAAMVNAVYVCMF